MLKKILYATVVAGTFFSVITTASADGLKTSSLSIAKTQSANTIPSQCQKMFSQADKLISDAEKQPGTHTQISSMKSKLSSTKQQILKLDTEMQQKSCDKGLVALNNLSKKF